MKRSLTTAFVSLCIIASVLPVAGLAQLTEGRPTGSVPEHAEALNLQANGPQSSALPVESRSARPAPAAEPAAAHTIYVGGLALTGSTESPAYAVTDELGQVTAGGNEAGYNLKWDGETLTLNSALITGAYCFDADSAAIFCAGDLTIRLVGSNTVRNVEDALGYGICNGDLYQKGDTVICGTGSLEVEGTYCGIYAKQDLTITEGAQVTATGSRSHGVEAPWGCVTVAGGSLTATGNNYGYGIFCGSFVLTGGSVTATALDYGCALATNGSAGTITLCPPEGVAWEAFAGASARHAAALSGSPFRQETQIQSLLDHNAYFRCGVPSP